MERSAERHPRESEALLREIWTIGYERASLPSLIACLRRAGVDLLVDVRAVPNSRRPGFSKRVLAAGLAEPRDTIEDVIEPYLIQQGYLQRTPRGRCATLAAYRHLGLQPPAAAGGLFADAG